LLTGLCTEEVAELDPPVSPLLEIETELSLMGHEGSPLCQDAATRAVLGLRVAGPGSD
jgi:hypothetical protein